MEPQNVIMVLGVSQNISVSGEGGTISILQNLNYTFYHLERPPIKSRHSH